MDCETIQEEILSSFDGPVPLGIQQRIDRHLSSCPICRAFATKQKVLDARLTAMLAVPAMTPGFSALLRERIRQDSARARSESLPEVVHFASCGLATLLCVILLPFDPSLTLAAGATATSLTYIPLALVRNLFREFEEAGQ